MIAQRGENQTRITTIRYVRMALGRLGMWRPELPGALEGRDDQPLGVGAEGLMITGWVKDSRGRRVALRNSRFIRRALWLMQTGHRGHRNWHCPYRRVHVDNGWASVWKAS